MKLFRYFAMLCLLAPAAWAMPEVGKPAPEIQATDIQGKPFTLSALKDELVVLEWTNHECPFVKKFYESGKMQEWQKAYTGKGVKWVRIVSSAPGKQGHLSAEEAQQMAADKGMHATTTILDPSGEIGKAYDAKTTPHMFVIHKGSVAYMGAIDSIRTPDPAKIAEAENYVAKALDSLLAGGEVQMASTQPYGCSVKY